MFSFKRKAETKEDKLYLLFKYYLQDKLGYKGLIYMNKKYRYKLPTIPSITKEHKYDPKHYGSFEETYEGAKFIIGLIL